MLKIEWILKIDAKVANLLNQQLTKGLYSLDYEYAARVYTAPSLVL